MGSGGEDEEVDLGELWSGRVESIGMVCESIDGANAESAEADSWTRRECGEPVGGGGPALGGQAAYELGYVHDVVEDHRIGRQEVELDLFLLLVGSLSLSTPLLPEDGHSTKPRQGSTLSIATVPRAPRAGPAG